MERLKQVIDQMAGIGGGRTMGFGAKRVRSLPDAVAQVLREHLRSEYEPEPDEEARRPVGKRTTAATWTNSGPPRGCASGPSLAAEQLALPINERPIGDLCPDCGQATFIPTEGCRKCYVCGYSEC